MKIVFGTKDKEIIVEKKLNFFNDYLNLLIIKKFIIDENPILLFNGIILEHEKTLDFYNIKNYSYILIVEKSPRKIIPDLFGDFYQQHVSSLSFQGQNPMTRIIEHLGRHIYEDIEQDGNNNHDDNVHENEITDGLPRDIIQQISRIAPIPPIPPISSIHPIPPISSIHPIPPIPPIPPISSIALTSGCSMETREKFKNQLETMRNMGFNDEDICVQGLTITNGNVEQTINWLLSLR